MSDLIIGLGEIGSAVKKAVCPMADVYDINFDKIHKRHRIVNIMHICFPYSEEFVDQVTQYISDYSPEHIIIWATVPIGTTNKIDRKAVHSPVEGRHPHLGESIHKMTRWIGTNSKIEGSYFTRYFNKVGINCRVVYSPNYTEFLKLRSTSKYGVNLVWTDYEAGVANRIGMDFKYLKEFDESYNNLYQELNMPWAQRYVLDPPNGKIGGHCVVPNAKLLDEQYPHYLLKRIKEMEG